MRPQDRASTSWTLTLGVRVRVFAPGVFPLDNMTGLELKCRCDKYRERFTSEEILRRIPRLEDRDSEETPDHVACPECGDVLMVREA